MDQSSTGRLPKSARSVLRHFSTNKVRSNNGCWTCRVRRKKCDERHPVCDACGLLGITCHFEDEKPSWMDGGPKQREMGEQIKAEVKEQASLRRDRKHLDMFEAERGMQLEEESTTGTNSAGKSQAERDTSRSGTFGLTPPSSIGDNDLPLSHDLDDGSPNDATHFTMVYLDYVFPYFFPFYRPSFLFGGRGWVLDYMKKNRGVYHTATTLASYFFGSVLSQNDADTDHSDCINKMSDRLAHDLSLGLRELQKEMRQLQAQGDGINAREWLVVMQSILHMLILEVLTGDNENWRMHLDAATSIFLKILPGPDQWSRVLGDLKAQRWPPQKYGKLKPWSTDQASLRFYAANLFYLDAIASITQERAPKLQEYQTPIIPGCAGKRPSIDSQIYGPIFMEDYIGLYNWVIQGIGDVAALDAWKKQQRRDGLPYEEELKSRGKVLGQALGCSMSALEVMFNSQSESTQSQQMTDLAMAACQLDDLVSSPPPVLFNIVWIRSVMIYLEVVLHGWRPQSFGVRSSVLRIKELCQQVQKATTLRSMVWPLCIAGCMATANEQDQFRAIAEKLGPLHRFGTIQEAMNILEKVWESRPLINEEWDLARCLNILGHGSLLI